MTKEEARAILAKRGIPLDKAKEEFQRRSDVKAADKQDSSFRRNAASVLRGTLELGGMAAGGALGVGAGLATGPGAPAASPALGVAGAGLGYAAGKQAANIADEMLGLGKLPGLRDQMVNTANDVGTGALMEASGIPVGKAISAVGRKVLAPLKGRITDKVVQAIELAKKKGIPLTAADISRSKPIALLESALEKFPFTSGMIQDFRANQLKALTSERDRLIGQSAPAESIERVGLKIQDKVDETLKKMGVKKGEALGRLRDKVLEKVGSVESYEALGMKTKDALKERSKVLYDKATELYEHLGDLVPPDMKIKTNNLQSAAEKIIKEQVRLPPSIRNAEVANIAKDLANLEKIGPHGQDFQTLQGIRKRLNDLIVKSDSAYKTMPGSKFQSSPEAGYFKTLRKALEGDIKAFSDYSGGEIKQAYDTANAFYGENRQLFNKPAIQNLLKANPERVMDMVFRPGGVTEIKVLKSAVGNETFQPLKNRFTQRLLGTDDKTPFSGERLSSLIDRYGEDTLAEIYSPQELGGLRQLASNVSKVEKIPVGNPFFRILIKSSPEKVVDMVIRPDNTMNIRAARSLMGEEDFKEIKTKFLENLMELNGKDNFSPALLANKLRKYGPDTLKEVFTPQEIKNIVDLSKVGQLTQGAEKLAGNPSGTAQNLITVGTGGAILNNPIAGIKALISGRALARAYLSEPMTKYLTEGFTLSPTAPRAAALTTKLVSFLAHQDLEADK